MDTISAQTIERGTVCKALRRALNDCKLISMGGLVSELGFNPTIIERELRGLLEKSDVDVLTSCCLVTRSDGTLAPEKVEFYRAAPPGARKSLSA